MLTDARQMILAQMSEREFRDAVVQKARENKWMCYFTWRSDHSPAGFPDIVAVRRGAMVVAELKSERGRMSADQTRWIGALRDVEGIRTFVWRPSDWELIAAVLEGRA